MSIGELKAQISHQKMRIAQLDQFGYEEESAARTKDLKILEAKVKKLEFDWSQLEITKLLEERKKAAEKAKRTRRRRRKKAVKEDVPE